MTDKQSQPNTTQAGMQPRQARSQLYVDRLHPYAFIASLLLGVGVLMTGGFLSVFTTGTLTTSAIIEYAFLALLNVAGLALSAGGVIDTYPWWVWYMLAFQWLAIAVCGRSIYHQFTGRLTKDTIHEGTSVFLVASLWFIIAVGIGGVVTVGRGWSLQQGVELVYAISGSFLTLPVALFSPLLDFSPEVWVAVVLLWGIHAKLHS